MSTFLKEKYVMYQTTA